MDREYEITPQTTLADEGRRYGGNKRFLRRMAAVVVLVGIFLAATRLPIPIFYAYVPGPVRDVVPLVEITGAETYSSEGALYLTTVSVDTHVTFVDWISAVIDPNSTIIMKEDLVPSGTSLEDLEEQQREQMDSSKQHALEVAVAALGLGKPEGDGARVLGTEPSFPAEGKLLEGDVIRRIDGEKVETTCDVGILVDSHEPGDFIRITVRRDGGSKTVVIRSARSPSDPDAPFVGVYMEDVGYRFDPGVDVDIKTGKIAGPSAGLMFSLAIYDLLTPEDITGGRKIAGTGEIACDGGVMPIGGIEQKVAGAEREGAEVFFSPAANYQDALSAAGSGIEVVSVSNFRAALEYLEGPE